MKVETKSLCFCEDYASIPKPSPTQSVVTPLFQQAYLTIEKFFLQALDSCLYGRLSCSQSGSHFCTLKPVWNLKHHNDDRLTAFDSCCCFKFFFSSQEYNPDKVWDSALYPVFSNVIKLVNRVYKCFQKIRYRMFHVTWNSQNTLIGCVKLLEVTWVKTLHIRKSLV